MGNAYNPKRKWQNPDAEFPRYFEQKVRKEFLISTERTITVREFDNINRNI